MRWPFGPPHLTLKPSKKNKTKKTKKYKTKNKKKNKKRKTKKEKVKKHKNTKKKSFSIISQNFLFLTGYPKIAFFDTLAQKMRTQKHYKNRGFSQLFFLKKVMRHETAIFGPKKPKFINSSYLFFFAFFFSYNNKNTKICWNPYFIVF